MKKVRFGIVGLGNQGTYYAKLLDAGEVENGVISALCDVNEKKIERMKSALQHTQAEYFTDFAAMLNSGLCDAVLVETPHYLHPEMAIACFARKIPVLIDKPAGVYAKQVREMNEAAKKSGVLFGVMFNQRTNCVYRKMREIIASGGIGELQRVTWIITDWFRTEAYYRSGGWRATWEGEGGGVLINQCPHQLDLVQWVVGELPEKVRGFCKYGRWHDIEVEDDVTAYFTYKNGATGVFITTTGETPGANRFEVSGTRGKLLCENDKLTYYRLDADSGEFSRRTDKGFDRPACTAEEPETDGENPQHVGVLRNFADAVSGKATLAVRGEDGIRGVQLMNAIELSGWRGGEEVTLPVNEEAYLAELNAHRAASRFKPQTEDIVSDTAGTFGSVRK